MNNIIKIIDNIRDRIPSWSLKKVSGFVLKIFLKSLYLKNIQYKMKDKLPHQKIIFYFFNKKKQRNEKNYKKINIMMKFFEQLKY